MQRLRQGRGTTEQTVRAAPTIVQTNQNRPAGAAVFYLALRLCDPLFSSCFRRCCAYWAFTAKIVTARGARSTQSSLRIENEERHFKATGDLPIQRRFTRRRSTRKPYYDSLFQRRVARGGFSQIGCAGPITALARIGPKYLQSNDTGLSSLKSNNFVLCTRRYARQRCNAHRGCLSPHARRISIRRRGDVDAAASIAVIAERSARLMGNIALRPHR